MNPDTEPPPCPLCLAQGDAVRAYHRDQRRDYLQCTHCALVFVPAAQHLSVAAERAIYDQHRNSPEDLGYRRFLGRLFEPLAARLAPGARGLDFGCGPGPTLSVMFEETGRPMVLYDPLYAPDASIVASASASASASVFDDVYDFVTATEVVEHLRWPGRELERVWSCVAQGGLLGIMTKLVRDERAFSQWHYKRDPTHVCFFSRTTFEYLARAWNAELIFVADDALLLRKL